MATEQAVTAAATTTTRRREIITEERPDADEHTLVPYSVTIRETWIDALSRPQVAETFVEAAHWYEHPDERPETEDEAQQRERREARERKIRVALDGEHATAVYRRFILRDQRLTAIERNYLSLLIEYGRRLANVFPSRKDLRPHLPSRQRPRTLARLDQIATSCEKKGFLRRWSLTITRVADDGLEEFLAGIGYQVLLPPGVITPDAAGWTGPAEWSNWGAKWCW
jgi:hypothetical protein